MHGRRAHTWFLESEKVAANLEKTCTSMPSQTQKKPHRNAVSMAGAALADTVFNTSIYAEVGVSSQPKNSIVLPKLAANTQAFCSVCIPRTITWFKVTVSAYPILQNFTSIPTFSVFIRYNLMQTGIPRRTANFIAIFLPWT